MVLAAIFYMFVFVFVSSAGIIDVIRATNK